MPYLKTKVPYENTKRLLKSYDVTGMRLATILGCSYPTAKKKIDNPGYISTSEWDKIRRYAHVPIEKIRETFLS